MHEFFIRIFGWSFFTLVITRAELIENCVRFEILNGAYREDCRFLDCDAV
jgi:hypothetical protein